MSSKRKASVSPLNSPSVNRIGLPTAAASKRRKSEHHSAVPVNLKGMKATNASNVQDTVDANGGDGDGADGEEEAVVMEEDDYATQAGWQGLAKQNLKYVYCIVAMSAHWYTERTPDRL